LGLGFWVLVARREEGSGLRRKGGSGPCGAWRRLWVLGFGYAARKVSGFWPRGVKKDLEVFCLLHRVYVFCEVRIASIAYKCAPSVCLACFFLTQQLAIVSNSRPRPLATAPVTTLCSTSLPCPSTSPHSCPCPSTSPRLHPKPRPWFAAWSHIEPRPLQIRILLFSSLLSIVLPELSELTLLRTLKRPVFKIAYIIHHPDSQTVIKLMAVGSGRSSAPGSQPKCS